MTRNTFWFRHDYSARNDEKILALRALHGNEAYGIFWMLVEYMAESSTGWISMTSMTGLAIGLGVEAEKLNAVVGECIKLELFVEKDGRFTSMRLQSHKSEREQNRKTGRLGGMAKASQVSRHPKGGLKAPSTNERRREEIEGMGSGTRDVVESSRDPVATPSPAGHDEIVDDATPTPPTSDKATRPLPPHLTALAMFAILFQVSFKSKAEWSVFIQRNTRISKTLSVLPLPSLAAAMVLAEDHWAQKRDYPMRLETVQKFLDNVGTTPLKPKLAHRRDELLEAFEAGKLGVFLPSDRPTPTHVEA